MRYLFIIAALVLVSCGQRGCDNKNSAVNGRQTPPAIRIPSTPAMLTGERERTEYLAGHYWDNFDFTDTAYIDYPDVTEQAFATYVALLLSIPRDIAEASVRKTIGNSLAEPLMFYHFSELFEKYLYDPNSPYRDEELYITMLEYIVASDRVEELEKIRPRTQLEMALKNRVGHNAADIKITLANGSRMNLYDVKADYTLLFINNPDCQMCAEIIREITDSPQLGEFISSGRLKIVALYPDEDLAAWRAHQGDIPSDWINAYDAGLAMRRQELYDLRAIPSLYLLDADKRVLIKDAASALPVEEYIYNNAAM